MLARATIPFPVVEAVRTAAAGPATDRHTTVILGEYRRGKTTLVNRLLRHEVFSTRCVGMSRPVRLRTGPTWRAFAEPPVSADAIPGPPFQSVEGCTISVVEGPAEILLHTSLVDTPSPKLADANAEDAALREALAADLLIVCLSAEMLLSESERLLIRERLLPLTNSEIILVVTHADRVEEDSDRKELEQRLARFVDRGPAGRMRGVFIPGGIQPAHPVEELESLIRAAVERSALNQEQSWTRRVHALLQALDRVAAGLPDSASKPALVPAEETPGRLEALLLREHRLALRAAEAKIRSRLAGLRVTLPDRFVGMQPEMLQHEGVTQLVAEVQAAGREAAEFYMEALKDGLTGASAAEMRTSADGLNPTAIGPLLGVAERPDLIPEGSPPHDMRVMALTGLGALLIMTGGALVPVIGGALAIYGAHQIRRVRQEEFRARLREDAVTVLQDWLTAVEPDFLAKLQESTDQVQQKLKERLATMAKPPLPAELPTNDGPATRDDVISRLAACRAACETLLSAGDLQ